MPNRKPTVTQGAKHRADGMGSDRFTRSDRSDSSRWIIFVLTATLIITGICWRIHVSQIRPSFKRMHNDLRQQFTEMETKYRSVNETKAQICELFTSRRDHACSKDWIRNEDRLYFLSPFAILYGEAKQHCCNSKSILLEINSTEEENFVNKFVQDQGSAFWIGKCKDGKMATNVVYQMKAGGFECGTCEWFGEFEICTEFRQRFICEKSAHLCPGISDQIQILCQQAVGPT